MIRTFWTKHSEEKMRYYNISKSRVLKVLKNPNRKEESIVEGAIANMMVVGKKRQTEIWVMYVILKKPKGLKVISVWRYPGRTPEGQRPVIPDDVLKELLDNKEDNRNKL
jgi:hypothetical protein